MATYYFWVQGQRVTCMAFGSHSELVSRDLEQFVLFNVQVVFIFTMHKVLLTVTAKTRSEGHLRGVKTRRKMIVYMATYFVYTVLVSLLKAIIFRIPNFNPQTNAFTVLQICFLCLEACRCVWNFILVWIFGRICRIWLSRVTGVASQLH